MHRNHLAPCVIVVGLGVALFLATGASAAGLGALLLILVCPIARVGMMWTMGGHGAGGPGRKDET